jgi:hypothetical protein
LHEGFPSGAARGARKRNGFAALFDGYEDRKKVEEESWHASGIEPRPIGFVPFGDFDTNRPTTLVHFPLFSNYGLFKIS